MAPFFKKYNTFHIPCVHKFLNLGRLLVVSVWVDVRFPFIEVVKIETLLPVTTEVQWSETSVDLALDLSCSEPYWPYSQSAL